MKHVGSDYFSAVNKIVNSDEYNNQPSNSCSRLFTINELNHSCHFEIKRQIETEGFSIVTIRNHHIFSVEEILEWLEALLGKVYCANPKKLTYAKVQPEKNAKYYINSCLAQPMHTDEGYTTTYPRYVALYCFKKSEYGGDSIIVRVKPLYDILKQEFSDDAGVLFQPDAITVDGAKGMQVKPLMTRLEDNEIGISYSFILKSMKCDDKVFQQFNFITNYIHDVVNQIRFKLQQGQILIFDNCRILHGRTRFMPGSDRLLYRFWFDPNSL